MYQLLIQMVGVPLFKGGSPDSNKFFHLQTSTSTGTGMQGRGPCSYQLGNKMLCHEAPPFNKNLAWIFGFFLYGVHLLLIFCMGYTF